MWGRLNKVVEWVDKVGDDLGGWNGRGRDGWLRGSTIDEGKSEKWLLYYRWMWSRLFSTK